jgi:hypothetical protein
MSADFLQKYIMKGQLFLIDGFLVQAFPFREHMTTTMMLLTSPVLDIYRFARMPRWSIIRFTVQKEVKVRRETYFLG